MTGFPYLKRAFALTIVLVFLLPVQLSLLLLAAHNTVFLLSCRPDPTACNPASAMGAGGVRNESISNSAGIVAGIWGLGLFLAVTVLAGFVRDSVVVGRLLALPHLVISHILARIWFQAGGRR